MLLITARSLAAPLLLAATWLAAGAAQAQSDRDQEAQSDSLEVGSYLELIDRIEGEYGAYGAALPEQLLSLGLALQREGRHREAVDVFKRGTHVARINDGLYSGQQIAMVRGQIESHIALGQMEQADERQHYLYRVQVRSLDSGDVRAQALMQQAKWQYDAYRLGLGEHDFRRLMSMWDLYRLALSDIADRKGETSVDLLPPLHGMLQAQYLIAGYEATSGAGFDSEGDYLARQQYNRFNAYRSQSFDKGTSVLRAIQRIEEESEGPEQKIATAQALQQQGDWLLWHGAREDAMLVYDQAYTELVTVEGAQEQLASLFGEPRALPAVEGVTDLPPMAGGPGEGTATLEFSVTERGQVVSLDRIDENEAIDGRTNRLMRQLRKTVFRPRFVDGQPVQTEGVIRHYVIAD